MPAATARAAELTKTPSVYVTLGHNGSDGYGPSKIEVYNHLTAEWRGQTISVEATADRYRHSSGLSDWRVIVHRTNPHVTDTARHAIREAVAPLVLEWVGGEEYGAGRLRANAKAIARELRDERYSTDGPRRLIAAVPLEADDRARLIRACDLTDERLELLETIGA